MSTASNRAISLKEFAQNMPPGIVQDANAGRYVFGSRLVDTLPYLVQPGADAAVKPDDVLSMPVSTQVFVYTFDLSEPLQLSAYQTLLNAVYAGWFRVIYNERHWDDDKKSMRVYLEVVERHRIIKPVSEYDSVIDQASGNKAVPIR